MTVQLGPDVYECILHRVVEPLCGIGVDILKVVVNKGFIVITMTNKEIATIGCGAIGGAGLVLLRVRLVLLSVRFLHLIIVAE